MNGANYDLLSRSMLRRTRTRMSVQMRSPTLPDMLLSSHVPVSGVTYAAGKNGEDATFDVDCRCVLGRTWCSECSDPRKSPVTG